MRNHGRKTMWVLTLVTFAAMSSGCARSTVRLVEEEMMRDGTGLHNDSGQEINGYVLSDGTTNKYRGYVRVAGQDSLAFWTKNRVRRNYTNTLGPSGVVPGPVLPITEVDSLDVVTYGVTPGAVLLILVGVGGIAGFVAASSMQDIGFGK